jgi:cell division protein FtsB
MMLKLGQQYHRYQEIQAEVELYRQKLTVAQDGYRHQQEQLKLYYSDSYLEQLARSSLGMVKIGEVVVSPAVVSDVRELNENMKDKDVIL